MNTCKTCKWWEEDYCYSPKVKSGNPEVKPDEAEVDEGDGVGIGVGFRTGPEFGCIQHELK